MQEPGGLRGLSRVAAGNPRFPRLLPGMRPHGLEPTRLLRPWDLLGKSTGVGCHCLLWSRMQNCSVFMCVFPQQPSITFISPPPGWVVGSVSGPSIDSCPAQGNSSHSNTNQTTPCFASEIRRDRARSAWHGRRSEGLLCFFQETDSEIPSAWPASPLC